MSVNTFKLIIAGIALGMAFAMGVYTFVYAKGYSYLSNNPLACANCHVMNDQFNGWVKSSHKDVATCNDCHTPHDFIGKYYTKASNGFWHSYYFTLGGFHEPIRMNERNTRITEQACRSCHQTMVESITVSHRQKLEEEVSCIRCHRSVGHMH